MSQVGLSTSSQPSGPTGKSWSQHFAPIRAFTQNRRAMWITVIALALIGSAVLWDKVVKHMVIPRNLAVVEPGRIFRSGQISQYLIRDVLADNRIGLVIFMSNDKDDRPDIEAERQACRELGIRRINCPLGGKGTGDVRQYAIAVDEMTKAIENGKPVLIHCHAGAQRTGGVIAAYRMFVEGKSADVAEQEMLDRGHDPKENPELIPYLNENMAELARLLVEQGTIKTVPNPLPVLRP